MTCENHSCRFSPATELDILPSRPTYRPTSRNSFPCPFTPHAWISSCVNTARIPCSPQTSEIIGLIYIEEVGRVPYSLGNKHLRPFSFEPGRPSVENRWKHAPAEHLFFRQISAEAGRRLHSTIVLVFCRSYCSFKRSFLLPHRYRAG